MDGEYMSQLCGRIGHLDICLWVSTLLSSSFRLNFLSLPLSLPPRPKPKPATSTSPWSKAAPNPSPSPTGASMPLSLRLFFAPYKTHHKP